MPAVLMTGLKWGQLRAWRRICGGAPACVSLNGAPKHRFPVVDFEVAIDGGSFGTMSRIDRMSDEERERFLHDQRTNPEAHTKRARKALAGLGRRWVAWVGPVDMMCEPFMLKKTGLTVREHQERTVENYVALCKLAPDVPWLPVVQGWELEDYLRCVEMYRAAGVDLTEIERVGIGSVCRRQATKEGVEIIVAMVRLGLRVHAFGFKLDGLRALRVVLADEEWSRVRADSAAWSKHAWKKQILLPGHHHGRATKNCANCPIYADHRRREMEAALST
jgi:hypothetical protein